MNTSTAHGRYVVPIRQWPKIKAIITELRRNGVLFEMTDMPNMTYEVWYVHDANKTRLPPARTRHTADCTLITFGKYMQTESVENDA